MTVHQRTTLQRRLLDEQQSLVAVLDRITLAENERMAMLPHEQSSHNEPQAGASGLGPDDDRVIAARIRLELLAVNTALRTLHDHPEQYGVCRTCHQPIAFARLEILPMTRYCERDVPSRVPRTVTPHTVWSPESSMM